MPLKLIDIQIKKKIKGLKMYKKFFLQFTKIF
jgi:hypothetical protein